MPVTQAEAAVMESTAARFETANEQLDTMLRRLMDELSVLQTRWQGAGGRSFEQVKQRWAADQGALNRALAETATAIRSSGRRYDASDSAASGRFTSRSGSLSLPL